MKELEFTNDMLERGDDIDNAVHECLCVLAEQELEWDMEKIAKATDALKSALAQFGIKVRHPHIAEDEEGAQRYADYEEE